MKFFIYTLSDPRSLGIRYVGKTDNLRRRFNSHMSYAGSTHIARWIQSLKKIGLKPIMKVLETIYDPEELYWQQCERLWIKVLRETGCDLTNLDSGGNSGKKASPETRAKQSTAAKGKVISPETRAKLAITGRNISAESRAKISKSLRNRSPELREQAAIKMRGQKRSEETRKRLSAAKRGIVLSQEHRRKLSVSHMGNSHTDESRAKISKTLKEFYKNRREQKLSRNPTLQLI